MDKSIYRFILLVFLFIANSFYGIAQQQSNSKPVPSLTSDGVMTRRSVERIDVGWKRYSPEGFGLSFELPGEPFERPYPVSPELQSQIVDSKVLDYLEDGLTVNIAHIVFKERIDLKWFAELMKLSLNPKYHSDSFQCARISLLPKGDRFFLSGRCLRFGSEGEMRALIVGSGKGAWFISVQTFRDKREGAAISSRILESVTVSR